MKMEMNICATCLLKDKKKLEDPKSSTACLHFIAWLNRKQQVDNIIKNGNNLAEIVFPTFCSELNEGDKKRTNKGIKLCQHSK